MSNQFMNREEGIRALREASEALSRAGRFLHERENNRENLFLHERGNNRENLIGTIAMMVGGLGQATSSLTDLLEDGILTSLI